MFDSGKKKKNNNNTPQTTKYNNLCLREKVAAFFPISVSFSLLQGWASLRPHGADKCAQLKSVTAAYVNIKLWSRKNIFCSMIAFPPTLTPAKRSLLWLQPGNGRQALGCSWLSSLFCLCWTHGDTPLIRSKVLKAIYFRLKTGKAELSYPHTRWGWLPC